MAYTESTIIRDSGGTEVDVTGANALKVDGSAVTQPVSAVSLPLPTLAATSTKQSDGTQKTQIVDGSGNVIASSGNALNVNATITPSGTQDVNLKQVGGVTVATGSGVMSTGTQRVAIASDNDAISVKQGTATNLKAQAEVYQGGTAVGAAAPLQVSLANTGANSNKLLVTPDSVALPANQSVNVNQVGGTAISVNSGTKDNGTQRMVIATDQPNLTTPLNVNNAQVNGVTVSTGSGVMGTGVQRVAISSDNDAVAVKGTYKYLRTVTGTLTITSLNSLANSATAGWQSARIDNTSNLYEDILLSIKLDMANTSPANDKTVYVYLNAWYYDGSTWFSTDGGTATLPSGSEGTYTIASPNNLIPLGVLAYTTADMIVQKQFLLSNAFGNFMPDGWSLVLINYTGAAVAGSGNVVQWTGLNRKLV